MKILVMTRSMGGGHNSAAYAVAEALERKGAEAEVVDAARFTSRVAKDASSSIYVGIVQSVPSLFGFIYRIGKALSTPRSKSVVYLANHKGRENMLSYINESGCSGVVCTNLFPMETLTCLKRRGELSVPCFGVVTDYTCIPFWEDTEMDFYFTPGEELHAEYIAKKIPAKKLIPSGIPVSERFLNKTDKNTAKRELGLDESRRYFLVMSGSMGAGNALDVSREILCRSTIVPIVICGSNNELAERVRKGVGSNAVIVGFTNEVEKYMSASEVVFTKAGGLTSTEAAAFGIPIIHTTPIPGCEVKNTEYFVSHGMSIHDGDTGMLVERAIDLVNDEREVLKMLENQRRYINRGAADEIAGRIIAETEKRLPPT